MKILLLGEYSRLHNSLKEGLQSLGHTIVLAGMNDHFKKYPIDVLLDAQWCKSTFFTKAINKIFKELKIISFEKWERAIRFYLYIKNMQHFDCVQLINSDALELYPSHSLYLYKKLFKKVKNRTLLVCGDETPVVNFWLKNTENYSVLTPYFENKNLKHDFYFSLKYTTKKYQKTYHFLAENCQNIIASDYDYVLALQYYNIAHTFIPNPINIDKFNIKQLEITEKITIFLGINSGSYLKKGIPYFESALAIIKQKYSQKISIIKAENLPYSVYIQHYTDAHILLDQVYAFDQGYNALEAMAQGKVVFTGAEIPFLNHFNLRNDEVAINALPDVDYLVKKLSFLIENPQKIIEIGQNAQKFIKNEHHYLTIAQKYLEIYQK